MNSRAIGLTAASFALVAGVLGVQLANGGGAFVPRQPANPCAARVVSTVSSGLEALTEQVVLLGLDAAACELGMSRERLVLAIADPARRATVDTGALRDGLVRAIDRLDQSDSLPPVSSYVDEVLDASDLSGVVKAAIRALPASVIDRLLPTAPLLRKAVDRLDMVALLDRIDDPAQLSSLLRDAIIGAAKDQILADIPSLF